MAQRRIHREIRKLFELTEDKITTRKKICNVANGVFKEKILALNAYSGKSNLK